MYILPICTRLKGRVAKSCFILDNEIQCRLCSCFCLRVAQIRANIAYADPDKLRPEFENTNKMGKLNYSAVRTDTL